MILLAAYSILHAAEAKRGPINTSSSGIPTRALIAFPILSSLRV